MKASATQNIVDGKQLKLFFNDSFHHSPVIEVIKSFFATAEDVVQFAEFVQEILSEDMLLAEMMQRQSLHAGILRYYFEQIGFLGASVDSLSNRVVLLRIQGDLFAVRIAAAKRDKAVVPVVEISGLNNKQVVQVLNCETFLRLWSKSTGNTPEQYDVRSSIQPYIRSLISGEALQLHGRSLQVESILGQGLEGTVFKIRDLRTFQPFALKVTYKDLRELFDYWSTGMDRLRKDAPESIAHLCEFYSCELAAGSGSTLLMQYAPLVPLQSIESLPDNRLATGLRMLADVVANINALHQAGVCHGDLGVSNVFIRRHADGCERAMLIDPHPEVCNGFEAHQRKDRFGIAHILYWIVTGVQWPEGTYPYLLQVMAETQDPIAGARIFSNPPLQPKDKNYTDLHAMAVNCLCDPSHYKTMVEKIMKVQASLNSSLIAAPGQTAAYAIITGKDVECRMANALKPVGSGIFMPLFSLPCYFGKKSAYQREYGMGDTGPAAREFVKLLRTMGQKFWMLLPIGPTDAGNCPYRTDSSFAISHLSVSPEELLADGWITVKELERILPSIEDMGRVALRDEAVATYKRTLLNLAFGRRLQKSKASWQEHYQGFLREEAYWLDDYALYKVIETHYPARWTQWPEALRDGDTEALQAFAQNHTKAVEQEKFCQFLAQHYFLKLRQFAEENGVYLIGDMPAYSMHGSADVWAHRQVFELAESGERTLVAGAPPDVFDANGQGWNHPMYRWNKPATIEFLKKKYLRMKQLFASGFVRDDHIIGKVTPWGYTFGQPPAQGHRVTGVCLGNPLFDGIQEAIPELSTFLIGEDLGMLTTATARVMQHYRFMGMKVLQFIPFNEGPDAIVANMYTPGNYSDANVLLLGTHDAPTIRQWWRERLNDVGRWHFCEYAQEELNAALVVADKNVAALFAELAMRQTSNMMIHQAPDLIVNQDGSVGLTDARMNNPSNHEDSGKNWSWRLLPDALGPLTVENLKKLTERTDRTPKNLIRRLKTCQPASEDVLLAKAILRKWGKAGVVLAQQLETMVYEGKLRYAPLGQGCLSAAYRHMNDQWYLLLSDGSATLEEQAVSLIRGLEAYVCCNDPHWKALFEGIEDAVLVESAQAVISEIEYALRSFVIQASDELREMMITVIGSLFNPSGVVDQRIQARLQAAGASESDSRELARCFQTAWTSIWKTYEQRDVSRTNIIEGILTGELHGAKTLLRGLRWRLFYAYAVELSAAIEQFVKLEADVSSWAKSLDLQAVEHCLFGTPDEIFIHTLDGYGRVEGLSGLLGLMRKAGRKEQALEEYLEPFRAQALSAVCCNNKRGSKNKQVMKFLKDARCLRSFEFLLEIIEYCLLSRLGELRPPADDVHADFPAEIDMQVHSYYSDCGGQSIAQSVYQAYRRGLKTLAITDHQSFDGIEEALEIGNLLGVQIIPAIELYAGIRRGGEAVEERRDILVYFPDVQHFLTWWRAGLDAASWQLFNDGWNRRLHGSAWGDVPIRRVTEWARAHGGVPVLAHPGLWSAEEFHKDDWSYESFERLFLETGLAGIEISHSRLPFAENTQRFVPLVKQFNQQHPDHPIIVTVGTDSHTTEGIGRANLTKEAVSYIAQAFAPEEPATSGLRIAIIDGLHDAARRIADTMPLYHLRDEVLAGQYAGLQAHDRPLVVRRTDAATSSDTLLAAVKEYKGRPVIVAVNTSRREQFAGKDWGSLEVCDVLGIDPNDKSAMYRFQDLITGEQYTRTARELKYEGLHIGLLPYATQFLKMVAMS